MENRIIVAVFDNQNGAFEAAQDVRDLERSGVIKIKRGTILTKDANGTLTAPIPSTWAAPGACSEEGSSARCSVCCLDPLGGWGPGRRCGRPHGRSRWRCLVRCH